MDVGLDRFGWGFHRETLETASNSAGGFRAGLNSSHLISLCFLSYFSL